MSKTLHKLKIILEYLWLIIAIVSIGIGAYEIITKNFKSGLPFLTFAFIALFFYSSRKKQRISTNPKSTKE